MEAEMQKTHKVGSKATGIRRAGALVVLLLVAWTVACAPPAMAPAPTAPGEHIVLDGTEWLLTSLEGTSPLEGATITLAFYPEAYMEGSAGCNSYGTDYTLTGTEFQLAEIHKTNSECTEPPGIVQQEAAYFEALSRVAAYWATSDRLEFHDASGKTILAYARKLPPVVDPALQGTGWVLDRLRGQPLLPATYIQLSLDRDGFGGFAGCNHYGGEYEAAAQGLLDFAEFAITAMDCPTPEGVVDQEQAYVEALRGARAYRLEGDQLLIQDGNGETILVYRQQATFAGDPADLPGTVWQLVSMDGQVPTGDSAITLAFHDERRASGHAGCRDYLALYESADGNLTFHYMAMLGALCPSDALLEQEGAYTTMLGWTAHHHLVDGRLELATSRGETLIFEPLPPEAQIELEGPVRTLLAFVEPNPYDEGPAPNPLPFDVQAGTEITAIFEGGTLRGSGGCNDYGAAYALNGASLAFEAVTFTEMACLDPAGVMEQERRYFAFLQSVTRYYLYANQLWLETGDGRALVFSP